MCGIMGYVGPEAAWPVVVSGLRRLEYRGYDSAGAATVHRRAIRRARATGPLAALERAAPSGLPGRVGIGHTRWATHGEVNEANCHPHLDATGRVAVVHNGIVDNADALRAELPADALASETDSELLAHHIARALAAQPEPDLAEAVRTLLCRVRGTAGLLVISADQPDRIVAARLGSPVLVGLGADAVYVASDAHALTPFVDRIVALDDGEIAELSAGRMRTIDLDARAVDRESGPGLAATALEASPQGAHAPDLFTAEMLDQPEAVARTLRGRLDMRAGTARLALLDALGADVHDLDRVVFTGCGTSLNAAEVGAFLVERHARIPAVAVDAAEARAVNPVVGRRTLYVALSQSGETADVLALVRELRRRGARVAGVTNVPGSSLARATDFGVHTHAGLEQSVAATKSFTCQIATVSLLACGLARARTLSPEAGRAWLEGLAALPDGLHAMLAQREEIAARATEYLAARCALFVGRGPGAAVAREGALKLEEIAYIPSLGLSAAAIKHGPIALVEPGTPVWAITPPDHTRDRVLGNLHALQARGAHVLAVAAPGDTDVRAVSRSVAPLPPHHEAVSAALAVVPLQIFAHACARGLGRNVDRPRNLAKSVTVE